MKRFFQVLLVIGIVTALSSLYFLNTNSIYAIFAATLGVMIVGFSVFEIISIGKIEETVKPVTKKAKPIASKAMTKKAGEDIEWTYYGSKKGKTKPTPVVEGSKKLKFTFFSKILAIFKLRKHAKVEGKIIEKEVEKEKPKLVKKEEPKKTAKDKETEKSEKLRDYIKQSIKQNIPKEKITEACLASDWPKEKVEEIFSSIDKKKNMKIKPIYIISLVAVILFSGLIVTDNFLIGYWLETLKLSMVWFYYSLLLLIVVSFGVLGFDLKESLSKKKRVYKVIREKKLSGIKSELKTKKPSTGAGAFQTDIDRLLDFINEKEKLTTAEISGIFGISESEAEQWGKILKDQGLITLYYPTVGEVELRRKKREKEKEE